MNKIHLRHRRTPPWPGTPVTATSTRSTASTRSMKRSTPWCTPTRSGCEPSSTRSSLPPHGQPRPLRSPARTGVLNTPNGATGRSHPRPRHGAASVVTQTEVAVPRTRSPPANPCAATRVARTHRSTRSRGPGRRGRDHETRWRYYRMIQNRRFGPIRTWSSVSPATPRTSRSPAPTEPWRVGIIPTPGSHRRDPDRDNMLGGGRSSPPTPRGGRSRPPCRLRPAQPAPITTNPPLTRPRPQRADPTPAGTVGRACARQPLAKKPTPPRTHPTST